MQYCNILIFTNSSADQVNFTVWHQLKTFIGYVSFMRSTIWRLSVVREPGDFIFCGKIRRENKQQMSDLFQVF
jgi:hypothetical protein